MVGQAESRISYIEDNLAGGIDFESADAPDIEVYPEGDTSSPNYKCEVWLPIIKK